LLDFGHNLVNAAKRVVDLVPKQDFQVSENFVATPGGKAFTEPSGKITDQLYESIHCDARHGGSLWRLIDPSPPLAFPDAERQLSNLKWSSE
jgi:hypothetical protein